VERARKRRQPYLPGKNLVVIFEASLVDDFALHRLELLVLFVAAIVNCDIGCDREE
jgi:hypothetical protein